MLISFYPFFTLKVLFFFYFMFYIFIDGGINFFILFDFDFYKRTKQLFENKLKLKY